MLQYKRLVVNGTASIEVTSELLVGSEAEPKKLHAVWCQEITGTRQDNAQLVGYLENLKVLDHDWRIFLDLLSTEVLNRPVRIPLDIDLKAGEAFAIGTISGGTASNFVFVAEYEVTGGRR